MDLIPEEREDQAAECASEVRSHPREGPSVLQPPLFPLEKACSSPLDTLRRLSSRQWPKKGHGPSSTPVNGKPEMPLFDETAVAAATTKLGAALNDLEEAWQKVEVSWEGIVRGGGIAPVSARHMCLFHHHSSSEEG